MKIYLNGELVNKEDAMVSVFDHGLLYGDGVFEGIRLYDGCVFKLDEHLERLEYSAKAILLDLPLSRQEFADAVCETCRANNLSNGYVRLVVTRGVGHLASTWVPTVRGSVAALVPTAAVPTTAAAIHPCSSNADIRTARVDKAFMRTP